MNKANIEPMVTKLMQQAEEIERLQAAKRRALSLSDERAMEAVELRAEIERLRLWIRRIDNINDDPARFSTQVDQACIDALAGKPMTGAVTVNQRDKP